MEHGSAGAGRDVCWVKDGTGRPGFIWTLSRAIILEYLPILLELLILTDWMTEVLSVTKMCNPAQQNVHQCCLRRGGVSQGAILSPTKAQSQIRVKRQTGFHSVLSCCTFSCAGFFLAEHTGV